MEETYLSGVVVKKVLFSNTRPQSTPKQFFILFGQKTQLLAPKASEASMGAFYFWGRAIGDCDYGVCGDCNAIGV